MILIYLMLIYVECWYSLMLIGTINIVLWLVIIFLTLALIRTEQYGIYVVA